MKQQSKTQAENPQDALFPAAENKPRAAVLLPLPVEKSYDYLVPDGMTLKSGDFVEVPFGPRRVTGIVQTVAPQDGDAPPAFKMKNVLRKIETAPPLTGAMLKFLDWVAQYTLSPPGLVLKMALSAPEALTPEQPEILYKKPQQTPQKKLTEKRKKILDILEGGAALSAAELAEKAGCGAGVIRAMLQQNMLEAVEKMPVFPCENPLYHGAELSEEQRRAADELLQHGGTDKHSVTLLDGVTGAGKTEVYFEEIAAALESDEGAQVLVLLPEIALTAQFTERFTERFGQKPALWHSVAGQAQRRKIWRGIAEGKTRVVVGARSALFLPFRNLSLIVLDEEHDASYKQEEGGPVYHARDMAIVRGKMENCPVILVSATPSLETVVNVQNGKYNAVRLSSRYAAAALPEIEMIDMRRNPPPERASFISTPLRRALADTLAAGEQALLFLNRRGYAPLTLCRTCGHRMQCPSCTAWLVKHRKFDRLQCHHCGYGCRLPQHCPECEDEDSMAFCGPGVERLEEEVQHFLPEARTLVLSSDVLGSEAALSDAMQKIHAHEADVIIGTQLVAKGHHFPLLTCVGVVDADLGLEGGDLRAAERSYQLLHQVAGRAGRAEHAGRVYLQSFQPENPVMRALAEGGRDAFFAAEIEARARSKMPPFGRLAALVLSAKNETVLEETCRALLRAAPRYDDTAILGPAPAPLAIIRGRHRRRFLIKAPKNTDLQKLLRLWLATVKIPSAIQLKIDIDPYSFL
ncbi:MAG: primosomal protein N' [Micavibrio sp.]|nr:MAG: primosomal protein N' [Micavibrio sp.]